MSVFADSSPLDIAHLLIALTLPTEPRRTPTQVMDRLQTRLYEIHEEIIVTRSSESAEACVYPRFETPRVTLHVIDEGRRGDRCVDHEDTEDLSTLHEDEEEEYATTVPLATVTPTVPDALLDAVFSVPVSTCGAQCTCRACLISSGILPAMEVDRTDGEHDQGVKRDRAGSKRPTIADLDVREIDNDNLLSPTDGITSPPTTPRTPNANRSRRPSEKLDYGINWIEAFKMAPPKTKKSTLSDEVEDKLSFMDQEEEDRLKMSQVLQKIDDGCRGNRLIQRSNVLIDSSISLRDIFGASAKSDDIVFNTSISLDDVFAGIKTSSVPPTKKAKTDSYYYHDDDDEEDDEEVLPPEVAALYSSKPMTISPLPQTSSVNIDDVFAALDRVNAQKHLDMDDYYSSAPPISSSEVFSDSALSSSVRTRQDKRDDTTSAEGSTPRRKASSSSGCSEEKEPCSSAATDWLERIVGTDEEGRPNQLLSERLNEMPSSIEYDDESTQSSSPDQLPPLPMFPSSPAKTRKESYLRIGELFSPSDERPLRREEEARLEEEEGLRGRGKVDEGNVIEMDDWISKLAEENTEEILGKVFECVNVDNGDARKRCTCQACDPTRSIYLERDAAAAEERKRSLHVVDPVEITLEEVFEGTPSRSQSTMQHSDYYANTPRASDIDLDVVFSYPVNSPEGRHIDNEKWQPRVLVKEVKRPVVHERKRSIGVAPLDHSDINLDEVFAHSQTSSENHQPSSDVNLDEILSASTSTKPRVDVSKFEPMTLERPPQPVIITNSSVPVLLTEPVDMEEVFGSTTRKETKNDEPTFISNSSVPVLVTQCSPSTSVQGSALHFTVSESGSSMEDIKFVSTSSFPRIVAECLVNDAIEEALRSPNPDQVESTSSSFPIFDVDDKSKPSQEETDVIIGQIPDHPRVDINLDDVFIGDSSSSSTPRVDLSKFESRTLERRKEIKPVPVVVSRSSVPVLITDPIDMDAVFNPSSSRQSNYQEENTESVALTQSSVPVLIVDQIETEPKPVQFGLEPDEIDLDRVFSGASSTSKPRLDLSKFEKRTLERRKEPKAVPVIVSQSSVPVLITDPIDMDQVFNPSSSRQSNYEESIPTHTNTNNTNTQEFMISNSSVPVFIADDIVQHAMEELFDPEQPGTRAHEVLISQSSYPVLLEDQDVPDRSPNDHPQFDLEEVELIQPTEIVDDQQEREHPTYPKTTIITQSSVPVLLEDDEIHDDDIKPLPVFARSRDYHNDVVPDRPWVSQSEDAPSHIPDVVETITICDVVAPISKEEKIENEPHKNERRMEVVKESPTEDSAANPSETNEVIDARPLRKVISPSPSDILTRTKPAEVDLDLVFSARVDSPSRVNLDKFQPRTLERSKMTTAPIRIEATETEQRSTPTLPAENIDIDQVFNPVVQPRTEPNPALKRQLSWEEHDIDDPSVEVDLDIVFNTSFSSAAESRVDLDKYQPRVVERDTPKVVVTETRTESTVPTLPQSNISVDDVFSPPVTSPIVDASPAPVVVASQEPGVFLLEKPTTAPSTTDTTREHVVYPRTTLISQSSEPTLPVDMINVDDVFYPVAHPRRNRSPRPTTKTDRPEIIEEVETTTLVDTASRLLQSAGADTATESSMTEPTTPPSSPSMTPIPPTRHRRTESISISSKSSSKSRPSIEMIADVRETDEYDVSIDLPRPPPVMHFPPPPPVEELDYVIDSMPYEKFPEDRSSPVPSNGHIIDSQEELPRQENGRSSPLPTPKDQTTAPALDPENAEFVSVVEQEEVKHAQLSTSPDYLPVNVVTETAPVEIDMNQIFDSNMHNPSRYDEDKWKPRTLEREKKKIVQQKVEEHPKSDLPESIVDIDEVFSGKLTTSTVEYETPGKTMTPVDEPLQAQPDVKVFDYKMHTPSRYDEDKWKPRTLEREKKKIVEHTVEERPKSDLPESKVDIDEVFSGKLTTTTVEYDMPWKRMTMADKELQPSPEVKIELVKDEPKKKTETWEDDLAREIDEYEARRQRLGMEEDGSMRSTISTRTSSILTSTPEGEWKRRESMRSFQEPVIALLEKEKQRKTSSSSTTKRSGSSGSYKIEHRLEHDSGLGAEARIAKKNGKMWRVDRVQKTASASIEDDDSENSGSVRIQVQVIPPLTVSMESLDNIDRKIDEAFDEALSPRSRSIEVKNGSFETVQVDVHRECEEDDDRTVLPAFASDTLRSSDGVYRSVTSLPSTSDTTKIVFPIETPLAPHHPYDEARYVTSASIRLEKTLPTPNTTLERNKNHDVSSLHWMPSPLPFYPVAMRKRSRSEGPLSYADDNADQDQTRIDDGRGFRMSWHPSGGQREDLEDRGHHEYRYPPEMKGTLTTTVRVAGYSSPKREFREARERRKKIIRKSRCSVSSSDSGGKSTTKPDEEEMLEVEVTPSFIILRGSYNLVVAKDEPLGRLLLSLSDGQPIVPAALDFSVLPKLKRLLRESMTKRARSVSMLSCRGASLLDLPDPMSENRRAASSNLYHPINNPQGNVNLCTAENRVCEQEVGKRLQEIRIRPESVQWLIRYSAKGGLMETKTALCDFYSRLLNVPLDTKETVLLPAVTSAYDLIVHLTCDPHDIVLTTAPYYCRITNDCAERNQCRIEHVPLNPDHPELIVSEYEKAYATWASKGERVRVLVIVNPHNPLGNVFKKREVLALCEWAISNDIFIIMDEILLGTIYTGLSSFQSMLSYKNELSKPEMVAWLSSLSKDLGIPGIKTCLAIIPSEAMRSALTRLEALSPVPPPSQLIVNQLLADRNWLSSTLAVGRQRLEAHARFTHEALADIGIHSPLPLSGICLMADFGKYLTSRSHEEEVKLHRLLIDHGVVLTMGESAKATEPGWFRVSFGGPKNELEIGMQRIYSCLAPEATLKHAINYTKESKEDRKEWLIADVRPTSPGTTVESP